MGWLRATYLTVGPFNHFLFAIALVASAYAYIIPPDKMIFASYFRIGVSRIIGSKHYIYFILDYPKTSFRLNLHHRFNRLLEQSMELYPYTYRIGRSCYRGGKTDIIDIQRT